MKPVFAWNKKNMIVTYDRPNPCQEQEEYLFIYKKHDI